ncbi:MAG TPA: ATP-binding cassette domain-containing protein, partial [Thermoanaerobaculia bacterium]|nr:ATP-binding cassette domain-containing protein [Thermoanaerobaculia bacterium]
LRVRKVQRRERQAKRESLLELVGLSGFGGRRPGQLSGGQQQRVALARALAAEPQVLLLDEPFGALDAKIRVELRHTIRRIQRELAVTTIFVTHDQEEAFAVADRLAVLEGGRLLEVGGASELYLHPRHEFVATFLGAANVMVAEATQRSVRWGDVELPLGVEAESAAGRRLRVVFRPEDVELATGSTRSPQLGRGLVEEATFAGSFERLRLKLPGPPGVRGIAPPAPFGAEFLRLDAVRPQHEARRLPLRPGDEVGVGVRHVHVVASATLRLVVSDPGGAPPSPAVAFARDLAAALPAELVEAQAGRPLPLDLEGFDIAVADLPERDPRDLMDALEAVPSEADHLLVVPGPAPRPQRLLVCVAVGEPGKADVSFAERLAWRLGAEATVLTVLPESAAGGDPPRHIQRFLEAAARVLARRGVKVETRIRFGGARRQILAELAAGKHGLLVLGAPVPPRGEPPRLTGLVARLLATPPPCPVLIVRAGYEAVETPAAFRERRRR